MKITKNKDWVTQDQHTRHINRLIQCMDNLTTSVSFIVEALQVANQAVAEQDQTIASLQEELRTLRADLNLRGGA